MIFVAWIPSLIIVKFSLR